MKGQSKQKKGTPKVMKSEVQKHFHKCNQEALLLKQFKQQQAMLGRI